MKIRILSDVHREFGDFTVPVMAYDADTTLVLAGDIDLGLNAKDWIKHLATRFKYVVYVLGNHEAYKQDLVELITLWNTTELPENVHVLQNRSVVLDGIKFVGTPLWSDFFGENWHMMNLAQRGISDFRVVRYAGQKYTVQDHLRLFKAAKEFLQTELTLESELPVVVVTHWMPSLSLIDEKYAGDDYNGFYASNLDQLIPYATVWLHGHTHESVDRMLGDTRVVCNPRGYVGQELNPLFDPFKLIEV